MNYQQFNKKMDELSFLIKKDLEHPKITTQKLNNRDYQVFVERSKKSFEAMPNFYVYGNVGAGKTFNVSKIKALGIYIDWLEFYRSFKDENFNFIKHQVKRAKLLIIDDLGTTKFTEYGIEILFEILNYRTKPENSHLKTIITTNLTLEDLKKKIAEIDLLASMRIIDRIKRFEKVFFNGPSLR